MEVNLQLDDLRDLIATCPKMIQIYLEIHDELIKIQTSKSGSCVSNILLTRNTYSCVLATS